MSLNHALTMVQPKEGGMIVTNCMPITLAEYRMLTAPDFYASRTHLECWLTRGPKVDFGGEVTVTDVNAETLRDVETLEDLWRILFPEAMPLPSEYQLGLWLRRFGLEHTMRGFNRASSKYSNCPCMTLLDIQKYITATAASEKQLSWDRKHNSDRALEHASI